jgi:hypothetical protein
MVIYYWFLLFEEQNCRHRGKGDMDLRVSGSLLGISTGSISPFLNLPKAIFAILTRSNFVQIFLPCVGLE